MTDTTTTALAGPPDRISRFAGSPPPAPVSRSRLAPLLAATCYLGFACFLTWPLVTHLGHSIYGAPGDPTGDIAFYRGLLAHHYNPFLPGTITQFSGPEGQPIPWPRDLASAPGVLSVYLLAALFGAIAALGLYTLLGYVLTGTATFLLARRLTKNTWAALIAGWAFAFYPFAAINGQGHLDNIQGWVIVLAVWRLLELLWHPSRRNGLLAGLAVALGMWWSPYFVLFVGVVYLVVTAAAFLLAWRAHRLRSVLAAQIIAAAVVLLFVAYLGVLSRMGTAEGIGVRTNTVGDLYGYAARPLAYVLPDIQSPLFGSDTRSYLIGHDAHGIESTLYVGVSVILLALAALMALVRRRLAPRLAAAVLALTLIAAAGVICSLPPEASILGVSVPFPSHFIAMATTTWRVYSRFVVVVMLALSILAAIGLDALTRLRGRWVKVAVMSLATIAVPLDLWAPQSGHVTTLTTPGIYRTLSHLPKGLVAEYPLAANGVNEYNDLFYEGAYDMPMINGYFEGSFGELRAYSLANLTSPSTAPNLAALGVRYVILDSSPPSWGAWPAAGTPGAGFQLIAQEPYASLYLVTARPSSPALPTAGEGFLPATLTNGVLVDWLEAPGGVIELSGTCVSCAGTLSMTLEPFHQPRMVTVSDSRGHVLARRLISETAVVRLPLRFTRRTTLRLAATPGPQPIEDTPEAPRVSLRMKNLQFTGG